MTAQTALTALKRKTRSNHHVRCITTLSPPQLSVFKRNVFRQHPPFQLSLHNNITSCLFGCAGSSKAVRALPLAIVSTEVNGLWRNLPTLHDETQHSSGADLPFPFQQGNSKLNVSVGWVHSSTSNFPFAAFPFSCSVQPVQLVFYRNSWDTFNYTPCSRGCIPPPLLHAITWHKLRFFSLPI